jgi:hypothetical protein
MNPPDYKLPANYSGPKGAVPDGQMLVDVGVFRGGGLIYEPGYTPPDTYTGLKGRVPSFNLPTIDNAPAPAGDSRKIDMQ